MIKVDISNVWGQISLPDMLAMEAETAAAHKTLTEGTGAGNDFLGWLDLPVAEPTEEMKRIQAAAQKIRSDSDVFVVIGIGGSYLGPRAAIELLQGPNHNIGKGKGNPQVFFAGNGLSTRHWNELCRLLEGKDFSVAVISKSGTTTEPAIAFRALRWMLERKYGTDGANSRIYAVTDPCKGALRQMATEEGWETFDIPANVGGRFSVLTAVGLLPMAVAGVDLDAVMKGAQDARKEYMNPDLKANICYQYAALRYLFYKQGKTVEILANYEPHLTSLGEWFKQLYAESEGKEHKGVFPVTANFSTDLHSIGQYIQDGLRFFFETVLWVKEPKSKALVPFDAQDGDGLNFLADKEIHFVNSKAFAGTMLAHMDGGVPNMVIEMDKMDEYHFGALVYFFEKAVGISGYLLDVNPFDQPGVEAYKKNMFALLGKPGYEAQKAEL